MKDSIDNIFLDGLPDEDFRGWQYKHCCQCKRCIAFREAAEYITNYIV